MLSAEYWLQLHHYRHDELAARSDEARRARALPPRTSRAAAHVGLRVTLQAVTRQVASAVAGLRAPRREDPALCC